MFRQGNIFTELLISIMPSTDKPKIIIIGETRIRLNNIKAYEVLTKTHSEKVEEKDNIHRGAPRSPKEWFDQVRNVVKTGEPYPDPKPARHVERSYKVLEIETFQRDVYSFSERQDDIKAALATLDDYFS